jgi:hypothetical protein
MAQMIIKMMGKHALRNPSITDHRVIPKIDRPAYFSGMIPIAGTANRARRMVTTRVIIALL